MSIRITVLSLIVAYLSVYAWRDWFRALCGAVVLMAFLQHGDMPRSILGIPGLNLWNILIVNVLIGWAQQRSYEGLTWDVQKNIKIAFLVYCGIVIWAFSRFFIDPTEYYQLGRARIVVDYLVNPLKFLIPGILFYDGCRTRRRVEWALAAIVLMYFLLAVQVIRYMGINVTISGAELSRRAANVIQHSIGYNRVDMSMMLAGASWATLVFSRLMWRKSLRWACWSAAGVVMVAQATTGGRMGYVTWGLVGLVFCLVKWRKLLLLLPLIIILLTIAIPGVRERMLQGFGGRAGAVVEQTDSSQVTSGRTDMWPYVIDKIGESPLVGYGRLGIVTTGLSDKLQQEVGEGFGHPHNAYLEILLDDGIIGFLCLLPLYAMIVRRSFSLFRDKESGIYEAAGGVALALFLALLFAGIGAQTFYPREGVLGMWAAAGIALRVWVEREQEKTQLVDESTDDSSLPEFVYPA